MNTLQDISFEERSALVRVDFNVPLDENQRITDDTRIRAALPTIKKILQDGGSVILMSHLGRPKNGPEDRFSLRHVQERLAELLEAPVQFCSDCVGESATQAAGQLQAGQVLLLENLRFYPGETKGDEDFASQLSQLGDIYVNDAFGTAHRAHASTAIIAQFFEEKCFGFLIQQELESTGRILKKAVSPLAAIIGGAKVSSKIGIIEHLLDRVDHLIIGGGMAFTFAKAMGGQVGKSLVEEDCLELAQKLIQQAEEKGTKLHLPTDAIAADAFSNEANTQVSDIGAIPDGWMGLDIGPKSVDQFRQVISESKTIFWNGPMGVFELPSFQAGTKAVAEAVADACDRGAYAMVGGGDSVAAVNQFGLADRVSYISTGGGALLEYVEGRTLPGIAAIAGNPTAA